ncbi:MAG: hypothetical protein WC712_01480 [Candidatus Brocadiia bacterium]
MTKTFSSSTGDHAVIRVKIDEQLMREIIGADTYLELENKDEKATRSYDHNCNRRELKLFNLLRTMVRDCNSELASTRLKMRIIEEGEGIYLEMDI